MEKVRNVRLVLTCLLLVFFMIIPQVYAATLESPEELEAFFDGALAMQLKEYKIPGATVAVVKDGEIVFSKGYGFADLHKQTPMDPETTLHRPGSNSKILVWTAVMQLVEQGRLDLHTDINAYLDFSIPSRIDGREAPPITLHHLMTHTAGFEDEVTQLFVSSPEHMKSLDQYVKNHIPERVFQAGSVMSYSNYGTSLAAYIVELVSGQAFSAYAEEHILKPLKMHSTTFEQPLPEHLASQMSESYRYEAGRYIPGSFEYVQSYPAGALSATTHDMARLIMAHLNLGLVKEERIEEAENEDTENDDEANEATQEVRILREETAKFMQSRQLTGHPALPGMTYGFIEADYNGHRVLRHGGDTLLFTTGLYFLPEENVGLYVAYNSSVGDAARWTLFRGFMDSYFPETDSTHMIPWAITPGTAANYVGTFHPARANFSGVESVLRLVQPMYLTVDEDGFVNVTVSGHTTRFGEVGPNLFQEINGTEQMGFTFDGGRVTRIHFAGPITWLRTVWYQTPEFVVTLLSISVLFMVGTILGWIRSLFRPDPRRPRFIAPKVLGVLFFLLFITIAVLFIDIIGSVHPAFGVPNVVLEPSSTLNTVLILTKILVGIGGLMVLTNVHVIVRTKGSRWQRVYFTLLTLSSLSVVAVLYQMNLF